MPVIKTHTHTVVCPGLSFSPLILESKCLLWYYAEGFDSVSEWMMNLSSLWVWMRPWWSRFNGTLLNGCVTFMIVLKTHRNVCKAWMSSHHKLPWHCKRRSVTKVIWDMTEHRHSSTMIRQILKGSSDSKNAQNKSEWFIPFLYIH